MRLFAAAVLAAMLVFGSGAVGASAAAAVPSHDGSRVGVQLVVLGAAAFTVIVVGSAAYLVRKRLGLAAPPPEQPSDGHH